MMQSLEFPLKNDTHRKIIHIDMDAFFASVEERDHPEFVGKPLVIARHPKETGGRGVVTTANYAARKFGIHSAMSAQKAYELCPKAIFKAGDYAHYREISEQVRAIFHRYTDLIEPISIDEAYLDVTENKIGSASAMKVAKLIQHDIFSELHLTCSAGVSYNKFLAKLGSDFHKPRGMTVITPENAQDFLNALPIEDFYGVGKATVPKMHEWGVFTGADLVKKSEWDLIARFGKMGYSLYRKVRGVHNVPVNPDRIRKSIGKEQTYGQLLVTEDEVSRELRQLATNVSKSLARYQKHGKTIVLKVRYGDFTTTTKRQSLTVYLKNADDIYYYAKELFESVADAKIGIRLLGITLTNLDPLTYENLPLPLFEKNLPADEKE